MKSLCDGCDSVSDTMKFIADTLARAQARSPARCMASGDMSPVPEEPECADMDAVLEMGAAVDDIGREMAAVRVTESAAAASGV